MGKTSWKEVRDTTETRQQKLRLAAAASREQSWIVLEKGGTGRAELQKTRVPETKSCAPYYPWEQDLDHRKRGTKSSIVDSQLREGQDLPQVTQQF